MLNKNSLYVTCVYEETNLYELSCFVLRKILINRQRKTEHHKTQELRTFHSTLHLFKYEIIKFIKHCLEIICLSTIFYRHTSTEIHERKSLGQ